MSKPVFPPVPDNLKTIAHYLKVAEDHDDRDFCVSYWCRLHAFQLGMKLTAGSKTTQSNDLLVALINWLEKTKSQNASTESIRNEAVAQANIENYAVKLFNFAEENDAAENFHKNMVKAFYTAGILFDVLAVFGDLSEDIKEKRKYAKWKAAYIHNCLKNGERPIPGPIGSEEEQFTPVIRSEPPAVEATEEEKSDSGKSAGNSMIPSTSLANSSIGGIFAGEEHALLMPVVSTTTVGTGNVTLTPEQMQQAQKYCKYASSALNYDDLKTAVENLQKALVLLQTGASLGEDS